MLPSQTAERVRVNRGALASVKPGGGPVPREQQSGLGTSGEFRDLAPTIHRQRLVVEGYPTYVITDAHIKDYLRQLSVVTDMSALIEPVTHVSDLYGWAGWIHWETSGAHFYSWERPLSFFSVDIYTCKAFDPEAVVEFTREYFRTTEIVAKEF
jgi:S-adenosylmethionine decarboxylase